MSTMSRGHRRALQKLLFRNELVLGKEGGRDDKMAQGRRQEEFKKGVEKRKIHDSRVATGLH